MQENNRSTESAENILSPEDQQAYNEMSDAYRRVFGREPDLRKLDALSEDIQDKIIDRLLTVD